MIPDRIRSIALDLASCEPTPFYLIDLDEIGKKFVTLTSAWRSCFRDVVIAYSYKTNSLKAITRLLRSLGSHAEVVSGTELKWAVEDGFLPDQIIFNGPVKTLSELREAIRLGVMINVDSVDEARSIVRICHSDNLTPRIGARLVAPYMAKGASRFGVTKTELQEIVDLLADVGTTVQGLHFHMGSNIVSEERYIDVLTTYLSTIETFTRGSATPVTLDIGGGLPARSAAKDYVPPEPMDLVKRIQGFLSTNGIPFECIRIVLEPGRYLVEDDGYLVTKVEVRKSRNGNQLLIVDAGINLIRSISTWYHEVSLLDSSKETATPFMVYGANCFESDLFTEELYGPLEVAIGDLLIVGSAGGYDIPSANVWTHPSPAIFGTYNGGIKCLRRLQDPYEVRANQSGIVDGDC
ncbi:MAG: hypothetical protein ACH37Z_06690 [Anaerolineae bacterium]